MLSRGSCQAVASLSDFPSLTNCFVARHGGFGKHLEKHTRGSQFIDGKPTDSPSIAEEFAWQCSPTTIKAARIDVINAIDVN